MFVLGGYFLHISFTRVMDLQGTKFTIFLTFLMLGVKELAYTSKIEKAKLVVKAIKGEGFDYAFLL